MAGITDTKIRNLKARGRAYQVADGGGLLLEIRPSGQKAWLYRYRLYGRQEKLSIGTYPEVTLKKARELHLAARSLKRNGRSPAQAKQSDKQRLSDDLQTVRGLAKAYIEDYLSTLASARQTKSYVLKQIVPAIGGKFLHEVTPGDCVAIVERIKRRGALSVARKVLEQLRGLFGYAVDRHLLTINPAAQVRAAKLLGTKPTRARTLSVVEIRKFLRAVESFPTSQANRIAFRLILLTLCRKGELVKAAKEHVDVKRAEWLIPAENAKNGQELIVYLSRQANAMFAELLELAGRSPWILPGRNPERHISIATLNQPLFIVKSRDKASAWLGDVWIHDLRRTGSTILHESGWPPHVIEKALNHTVGGVAGVYNRALYAEQRREMLQWWADLIEGVEAGAEVVPLHKTG